MIVIYLSGEFLSAYLAYRMFRHECELDFHTMVGMIFGVSFFSWIAVILILTHFKLHYKWEIRRIYESEIKQRALLL
jgi:hypothetical protein